MDFAKASSLALFAKAMLVNPRAVGAACPSSARLAKAIASFVPIPQEGYVLELGAGTGSITAALLERGIDPERLILVELSSELAKHLRQRFPHLRLIHGDAVHLKTLLGEDYQRIESVVSGLPLRSLPRQVVYAVIRHFDRMLKNGGTLIQFTYDLRPRDQGLIKRFSHADSKIVWQNLPPARVDVFKHRGTASGHNATVVEIPS